MHSPFRDPVQPAGSEKPARFVYPVNEFKGTIPIMLLVWMVTLGTGILFGGCANLFGTESLQLGYSGFLAVICGVVMVLWRQATLEKQVHVTLTRGLVAITRNRECLYQGLLTSLRDVVAERETERTDILDGAVVSAEVSRLVFVDATGQRTPLSEHGVKHTENVEWLAKLRTFLKEHGWAPTHDAA